MRRYKTPEHFAYFDGMRYHCYNIDCYADHAKLREISRTNCGTHYLPILQCSECGTTYFGLITRNPEAEQEKREYATRVKRDEEERAHIAQRDNAEAIAEIRKQEAKEEKALRAETDQHDSEINGDIILPNIIF